MYDFNCKNIYAISCCAAVLTVCTHVPKYLQFAQINKKFQSDENKKLIVQRSEIIVIVHSRIEPKQLRKTVIIGMLY